jgi:hypothetical protein
MLLEAHHKLGIPIAHNKLWHPMMLDPNIKNNFVKLKVVTVILIETIFANLKN